MKIQLLLADSDRDYTDHLSRMLAKKYADVFEVSSCSSAEQLPSILSQHGYEVALIGPALAEGADLHRIRLPLLLWDSAAVEAGGNLDRVRKYQRVSTLVGELLDRYAEISSGGLASGSARGQITAVWSPAGGVGKTTAALAYATQKVSRGRKTVYLDLEPFSSGPTFFPETGKSISTIFEKLDSRAELTVQGIRQEDSGSGICYFCRPNNYEDISILSVEDVLCLSEAAAADVDELVIDLGAVYDARTAALLDLADVVLLVADGTQVFRTKWDQFQTQHVLYEELKRKSILVVNRGGRFDAPQDLAVVNLPLVRSADPIVIYKTLSAGYFQES